MDKSTLTTGQAAELCSVTRDAILKWVKSGKLQAFQTAGGHFRINRGNLDSYLGSSKINKFLKKSKGKKVPIYCWEYYSVNGEIKADCRECVVYKSKTERCFILSQFGKAVGFKGIHCKETCFSCEYFNHIDRDVLTGLIISGNHKLVKRLKAEQNGKLVLHFARNDYEASALLQDFIPDFIVVDGTPGSAHAEEVCSNLADDKRIGDVPIIIAVKGKKRMRKQHKNVKGYVKFPIYMEDLTEYFLGLKKSN
jgi:excisionase family DNA binding protein